MNCNSLNIIWNRENRAFMYSLFYIYIYIYIYIQYIIYTHYILLYFINIFLFSSCYHKFICKMTARNMTTMSGFLLVGFSDNHELQILQALLFLVTYLLGSAGNCIIITITTLDPQLQFRIYYTHTLTFSVYFLRLLQRQYYNNKKKKSNTII